MKYIHSLIYALLIPFLFSLSAMAETTAPIVLKISCGASPDSIISKQFNAIYTEIFRRLNIQVQFTNVPLARALKDTNSGITDLDTGRIYTLNEKNAYPNLIRADEIVLDIDFAAFALDPKLQVSSWDDLRKVTENIAYLRGLKIAEKNLPRVVSANRLIINNTNQENCRMLMAGRINVFIGLGFDVIHVINEKEVWKNKIKKAGVAETGKIYPYFNVKHKHLIPEVERILKAMKADGTYARLLELNEPKN